MPTRPPIFRNRFAPLAKRVELRGTAAQRGYDSRWRAFRLWFLRQNPVCVFHDHPYHRHECTHAATVVDHIQPLTAGGARLDETNCRPVCATAHQRLTQNYKTTGKNELPAPELPTGFWA